MPITVTPFIAPPAVGPGIWLQLASSHNDFVATPTLWDVRLWSDSDRTKLISEQSEPGGLPSSGATLQLMSDPVRQSSGQYAVPVGTTVQVETQLRDAANAIVDTGIQQLPWSNDALGQQAIRIAQFQQTSSGFTTTDRQQLQAIDTKTDVIGEPGDLVVQTPSGPVITTISHVLSRQTLDLLTLTELTAGESFVSLRASFSGWYYGVIVRVTTIAGDLVPKTPDVDWYFPDLAVLRIFRGQDLEYRRGIHTPTFMQEQPWQWGWQFLNESDVLGVPPDLTIAVDWREGCGGRVFLQRFP